MERPASFDPIVVAVSAPRHRQNDLERLATVAAERHRVILLESYPYYFQPQTREMLALLRGGAIGTVQSVQACFGFTLPSSEDNIRMKPDLGGGALLDAGSYALSLIRLAMEAAPVRVSAEASWADTGVDISMMVTLAYADGRRAQLSCAMDAAYHRRGTIVGDRGTIDTEFLNTRAHGLPATATATFRACCRASRCRQHPPF